MRRSAGCRRQPVMTIRNCPTPAPDDFSPISASQIRPLDRPGIDLHLRPSCNATVAGHAGSCAVITMNRHINTKTFRGLILFCLTLLCGSGCSFTRDSDTSADQPLRPAAFGEAVLLGKLENRDIREASGMAASREHPGVLWIVNDGGNAPALYAVNMRGAHLGRVRIRNAQNVDWEDIASFRADGIAILLIADFGDNYARRSDNVLYFVHEPSIAGHSGQFDISAEWFRQVRFEYEDGPRDCEAVAVDPDGNQILLLTKRTAPPVMYVLPLETKMKSSSMVARRLAVVENLRPPAAAPAVVNRRFEKLRSQPTAMDISPNGLEIAILTYGDGYLFRRPAHLRWSQVLQNPPEWIRMPTLRQAEALCFGADGQALFVTSEQLPAPLYRLDRHLPSQRGKSP